MKVNSLITLFSTVIDTAICKLSELEIDGQLLFIQNTTSYVATVTTKLCHGYEWSLTDRRLTGFAKNIRYMVRYVHRHNMSIDDY